MRCGVFLLALLAIFLVLYAGFRLRCCHPVWGGIVMSLAVLGLGWLILSVTHRLMMHNLSRAVVFALLFASGIWVYRDLNPAHTDAAGDFWHPTRDELVDFYAPINNTLSIFFPSRGSYGEPGLDRTAGYHVIHLLSYLFAAMIAFSWFGRRTINRSGYLFVPRRHRNIFWGYSEGGLLLARDVLARSCVQQVVFVLPQELRGHEEEEKRIFEQIDRMGGMVLYRDMESCRRLPRGHRHFFLTEDQDFNMHQALTVAAAVKRPGTALYVRTELPQAWTLFEDGAAETHIFNQSDLTARQFVQDNPILTCAQGHVRDLRVDYRFNVLQLGFGWSGREVLHKTICDAQYVGSRFAATVIDRDFGSRNGSYPVLWDECIAEYNLDFNPSMDAPDGLPATVGSEPFYRWIRAHLAEYCRVVVALGDDRRNLEMAMTIARIAQEEMPGRFRGRIFAHVREPRHYDYCSGAYAVTLFGDLKRIYTVDVVIGEVLDLRAKAVNYVYSRGQERVGPAEIEKNAERVWRSVGLFDRDSSRATAANIANIEELARMSGTTLQEAVADPASLEVLAETEHLRWNAFHFTKGIRRWPLGEIPEGYACKAKRYAVAGDAKTPLAAHACLVRYDELGAVSDCVNRNLALCGKTEQVDYCANDRRIVGHFPIIETIKTLKK